MQRRLEIDDHTQNNTTSVYTTRCNLPDAAGERLSTDLTSLGEGRARLAIVIEMVVEPDGTVKQSDVYRAAARWYAGGDERVEADERPAGRDIADDEVVLPAERDPSQ